MSSFAYFFSESLKGFARNLSTALGSIVTIFLSLLIIGVFLIGGLVVDNIVNSVEDKVSITAYVADDASQEDIDTVENYITGLDGVASIDFTTKDQALENFKNSMTSNPEIVDQLDGQNPLPASIDVQLSDAQMVETVAGEIESNETFQKIADNPDDPSDSLKYGQKTVDRLFTVTNYIRTIGVALVVLLIFIAFVFINNTIRLSILARRKEIAIMRLVGASNNFIRGPFLMEGALHAIIGAGLSIIVMEVLRRVALPQIQSSLPWLPINIPGSSFGIIYLMLLVSGLVIGLLGSALAMRRYLKV
ncbi:MAG: permease-like cell division protein FtsX [Denitrobacterium sp.]|jgi:cell division transport system permease protein|nr:permease-like cell division protein FtsX [Denitrobacterium sp.]